MADRQYTGKHLHTWACAGIRGDSSLQNFQNIIFFFTIAGVVSLTGQPYNLLYITLQGLE